MSSASRCAHVAAPIAALLGNDFEKVEIDGIDVSLAAGLELERRLYEVVLRSDDRNEGLRAFVEKRVPVFHGK